MKKHAYYLLVFVLLFFQCDIFHLNNQGKITIMGQIPALSLTKQSNKSENSLDLSVARYVMVQYGNHFILEDINDNLFSIDVPSGWATAMIFMDSNYTYIGNLYCGGMQILPLVGLSEGDSAMIDLNNLSLDGYCVIPTHDPVGNEIQLSETDITFMKRMGSYYESIVKNMDSDNDGIPDILNQNYIILSSIFELGGGIYGSDSTEVVIRDSITNDIRYSIRAEGGKNVSPEKGDIHLYGPVEDPYAEIISWYDYLGGGDFIAGFFIPIGEDTAGVSSPVPFKFGIYTLKIGDQPDRTLAYSNIGVEPFLIIAAPTIHVNDNGKLISIEIDYRLPDGTPIDPSHIITDVAVAFDDTDPGDAGRMFQIGELYNIEDSPSFEDLTEITVFPPRDISDLYRVSVGYTDLLGNCYSTTWFNLIDE